MPQLRIKKAVIPAAGLGTRLLPATKVVPKELLPVAGRPLIQYAIEEAAASGIEIVVLVIGPGKELIQQYLADEGRIPQPDYAEIGSVSPASKPLDVRIIWQQVPTGLASAIALTQPVIGDDPFVVILPDALIRAEVSCTAQLINCFQNYPGCVIATQLVEEHEVERFGIVETEHGLSTDRRVSRVTTLLERPGIGATQSRTGIFGRYVLLPGIFDSISRLVPGRGGEFQLTDALSLYSESAPVYACRVSGEHFDAGSKLGLIQATVKYGLADPSTAAPLFDYLSRLDGRAAIHRTALEAAIR